MRFLEYLSAPLTRAHGGCHGSEAMTIPFINFANKISEPQPKYNVIRTFSVLFRPQFYFFFHTGH